MKMVPSLIGAAALERMTDGDELAGKGWRKQRAATRCYTHLMCPEELM